LILGGSGNDLLAGEAGDDMLLAGSGRDDLFGGSGNDVLVAGDSDDLLYGGSGRDLLIGGQDNDWLEGGSDDDILIGGVTIHDDDVDALDAVMAVWTSSLSFADRVETLTEEGGLLEAGVAVFDDDDSDVLIGGSGRDLVFADITFAGGDRDCVLFSHHYDYLEVVN
jgi:Ca2+-binding RTX toxin-like protein